MSTSKIIWPIILTIALPAAIVLSFFLLIKSTPVTPPRPQVLSATTNDHNPAIVPSLSAKITSADARPIIIKNYLKSFSSPLEPYSQTIIDISDKYSLDYRLLVAIARQESNLCKRIPYESYNCWGFGIYGDLVTRFDDYPQALETVAKTLKRDYINKGLTTPEAIMAKYTPPSVEIGGPWAKAVNSFLSELE